MTDDHHGRRAIGYYKRDYHDAYTAVVELQLVGESEHPTL